MSEHTVSGIDEAPEVVVPNFQQDVPRYFPVHSSLRVNTDYGQGQLQTSIDESISLIKSSTQDFLDYVTNNPNLLEDASTQIFLHKQTEALKQLLLSKHRLQALQSTLKSAYSDFIESRRNESDLNLANYNYYRDLEKADFADTVIEELDRTVGYDESFDAFLNGNPTYQFLRKSSFIIANPEDPIPDDVKDEELAVAGGKISLKDPLSLNYFVQPVSSRKCQHVYEKEHISRSLQSRQHISCPVTGCEAQLSMKDLQEDKIMALRVKVFLARSKKRDQPSLARI